MSIVEATQRRMDAAARAGKAADKAKAAKPRNVSANADPDFDRRAAARFPLETAAALATRPPAVAIIKGVVHEGDVGAIYAGWGVGKSFVALHLLHAMSEGDDWFGHKVARNVPCLYIGLEGQANVPKRVQALQIRTASELPNLRFLLTSLDIRNTVDREELIASIRHHGFAGGALCVDTFNASTLGMVETTSEDMGEAIAAVKHLQREFGGVVILVHHSGKDRERGMRGHSSLEGAADFIIELSRDSDRAAQRTLRIRKVKDGVDGAEFGFELPVVEVGVDEQGDPITSCVVSRVLTAEERAATHIGAVMLENERLRADDVVMRGFHRLRAMGINATDSKNSGDYLPRKLLDLTLSEGLSREELTDAMLRMMAAGRLSRGVVGHYGNRTPKLGLILAAEVSE